MIVAKWTVFIFNFKGKTKVYCIAHPSFSLFEASKIHIIINVTSP